MDFAEFAKQAWPERPLRLLPHQKRLLELMEAVGRGERITFQVPWQGPRWAKLPEEWVKVWPK